MSSMNYYTELLYLFIYFCWICAAVTVITISIAILVWCIRKIKEYKGE